MKAKTAAEFKTETTLYFGGRLFKDSRGSYEAGAATFFPHIQTDLYDNPAEFFRDFPDHEYAFTGVVRDGELVHSNIFSRSELTDDQAVFANELEQKARSLPVVTSDTHEPVPGENFRRYSTHDPSANIQARRRAVELGYSAVILHNLPGEKYGARWSPARPTRTSASGAGESHENR